MASGYEKSDDYGGPEPRWPSGIPLFWAIVAAIIAVPLIALMR